MTIRMKDTWRSVGLYSIIAFPIILIFSFFALQFDSLWLKIIFWYFAISSLLTILWIDIGILMDEKELILKTIEDIQNANEYEYQSFGSENKSIFSMIITRESFYEIWNLNYHYRFLDDIMWKEFVNWLNQFTKDEKIYCVSFCIPEESVRLKILQKYQKKMSSYIFV